MDYDTPISLHMAWTEQLGGHPITYTSIGNASGGVAKAASAIETRLANVVVIYFGNANNPNGPRQLKMLDRSRRSDSRARPENLELAGKDRNLAKARVSTARDSTSTLSLA